MASTTSMKNSSGAPGHAHFERLRRSLRWQLLAAYSIPLILTSVYFYFQYSVTLREEVHAHLRSIAENQRNTVDLFLRERIVNLSTAFRPGAFEVPATDADMSVVLETLRQESSTFSDVGLFDPRGTLVAYAGPHASLRGRSYAEEPWYQRLHEGGTDHYISDVFLGFRGRPHFVIAVRRNVGDAVWVLRASVDPQRFAEFVGRSHLLGEGEAFIVNRAGEPQTSTDDRQEPAEARHVFTHSPETGVVEFEQGGHDYLAAVAWLSEHDWAVVVRLPAVSAHASLHRTWLIIAGVVLLAIVITVLLALRSTRRLVERLEAASQAKETLRKQLSWAAKLVSVGEMAAGVAHEINNPLAVIHEEAGFMKDLLDPEFRQEFDADEFRERLNAITDAAMRGRGITSKLLVFSRRHEARPEPHDINEVVAEALVMKAVDFKVSNIKVVEDFEPDLPQLLISRNEMEQVLLNLLNNARDAIGRSGTIALRTARAADNVEITIRDTGCGMSTDQLEQIFFPFFTTKEVGRGTGLGLSISHGIIESFGGRIGVDSTVGVGTVFTITLPAFNVGTQPPAATPMQEGAHV